MRTINLILFLLVFLTTAISGYTCGNQYYYRDQQLPRGNGFLDYHRLFVSYADSSDQHNSKHNAPFPYLYPMEGLQSKSAIDRYRDEDFNKLYDSIIKIAGTPKNPWKLGYQEIGMRAFNHNGDYKLLSDFAWKLAQKGELKASLTMLTALVLKYPNEYNILANLGTVYELSGKPRSALDYLARAIRISPESHYGSEWIHIHILQVKLGEMNSYDMGKFFAMDKSETSYSDELFLKTINPAQLGHFHRDTLMVHLAYQLHERMYFITANDELMGEMLYMILQCMLLRGDKAYASEAAALCIRYLPVNKREKVFKALAWALRG